MLSLPLLPSPVAPRAVLVGLLLLASCAPSAQPTDHAATGPSASAASAASTAAASDGEAVSRAPKPSEERMADVPGCREPDTCLRYRELVTGGASPTDTLPMLVALHGLGDRPDLFAGLVSGIATPARVVLFRGVTPFRGGYSWFSLRPDTPKQDEFAADLRSVALRIARATEHLAKERPTVGRPVVTGFSQGGILSFALAVAEPRVFARALPIAGMLPKALWPSEPCGDARPATPVLAFHGGTDRVIAPELAKDTVDALLLRGCSAKLETVSDAGHDVPPPLRQRLTSELAKALDETAPRAPR